MRRRIGRQAPPVVPRYLGPIYHVVVPGCAPQQVRFSAPRHGETHNVKPVTLCLDDLMLAATRPRGSA